MQSDDSAGQQAHFTWPKGKERPKLLRGNEKVPWTTSQNHAQSGTAFELTIHIERPAKPRNLSR
jgi:hypothetical protein